MLTTSRYAALVVGFAGVTMLGCPQLPDVQWRGDHVDFAADKPEQVCAGTREYLDRRAGQILERVGSESTRIDYYFLEDIDDFCSRDDIAAGCGYEGVVYSELVPHMHEIVHARAGDRMPPILEEGLATYLGDPYRILTMAPRERMAEMLTSDIDGVATEAEYGRAAHFVSFLVERYGLEAVLELDAALSLDSDAKQMHAAFDTVLGLGLDALLAEYDTYPECTGNVDMTVACAEPSVTLDFVNTRIERNVDCAASDGVGPHGGLVFVEDVVELGPAVDGSRAVSGFGDGMSEGGFVVLRRCGPCGENGVAKVVEGLNGFVSEQDFPAGRYVVRFYMPIDAGPAVVGLEITG